MQECLDDLMPTLFNSHPHKEDDNDSSYVSPPLYFSTHILTRRMTKLESVYDDSVNFQLTSSQGG